MAERRDTTLNVAREKLAHVCRKHHIKRLSLFGSQLSGEARDDSDVDMLVEFEPGRGCCGWRRSRLNCPRCSAATQSICVPRKT